MTIPHVACSHCGCQHRADAKAIAARIGGDPGYAELWKRLDQAERDRNRMLNALQHIRDQKYAKKVTMPPRDMNIILKALSRVEPAIKDDSRD